MALCDVLRIERGARNDLPGDRQGRHPDAIRLQIGQIQAVRSIDHDLLVDNIVSVARLAETFHLPVVLSTVNVADGQGPTVPELKAVLSEHEEIDRTTINSWEDVEFRRAVEATGRRKLIMTALWTEVCLAFPTLDALRAGFEVYPVVDAVGGTSPQAHRAGLERIVQAGAKPVSWVSLACELQRDWADASLSRMADEEVEAVLTEVPGIGPWTAHGFLLVALDRPDVFLSNDLALLHAVQRA